MTLKSIPIWLRARQFFVHCLGGCAARDDRLAIAGSVAVIALQGCTDHAGRSDRLLAGPRIVPLCAPRLYLFRDWRHGTDEPGDVDYPIAKPEYITAFCVAQIRRAIIVGCVVIGNCCGPLT